MHIFTENIPKCSIIKLQVDWGLNIEPHWAHAFQSHGSLLEKTLTHHQKVVGSIPDIGNSPSQQGTLMACFFSLL